MKRKIIFFILGRLERTFVFSMKLFEKKEKQENIEVQEEIDWGNDLQLESSPVISHYKDNDE